KKRSASLWLRRGCATCPASRFSISAFRDRQLGKPWSRATAICAEASFARGFDWRSFCNLSLASFFRYSSEGRSGSDDFGIDAFLPFLAGVRVSRGGSQGL